MNRFTLASVLSLSLASVAVAATPSAKLTDVGGAVLVDRGAGFVKIGEGYDLPVGSRVLVSKGGKATIAYAGGCNVPLDANSITTVVAQGACTPQEQVAGQGFGGFGGFFSGLGPGGTFAAVGGASMAGAIGTSFTVSHINQNRRNDEAEQRRIIRELLQASP